MVNNIKVAVRIRPLSQRELLRGEEVIVRKENKSVLVNNPKIPEKSDSDNRQRIRRFDVDFCYDPKEPEESSQEAVYSEIGLEVLDSMFKGYNACVLAYGHSASGKTYTIMGLQDDPGLTPRLCQGLFEKLNEERLEESIRVQVVISFLEIYNEKVRDLLGSEDLEATSGNFSLRVREHPKLGPYVQGLSRHLVKDKRKLVGLLTSGNRKRITAATENNIHSSRSHAVFTIQFKQSDGVNYETEKFSKVHLVDLAGSERASSSQSKARLKEGANINKSLVTLGNVISALAKSCESERLLKEHSVSKSWQPYVPYRDSVLTWLLKDTLGGNSNTIMIATVSPASGSLGETVNTLRYAKRTKNIVNRPIVNEDPKIKTIRQLKKEITRLRRLLFSFQSCGSWWGFEESNSEETTEFSKSESKWLDSGGTIVTIKEDLNDKKDILEKSFIVQQEAEIEGKANENEEKRKKLEKRLNEYETGVLGQGGATPPRDDACRINDAKKSDVNGSFNDSFSHETLIFSDSLESFSSVFFKRKNSCDVDAYVNDVNAVAGFACKSREFSTGYLNLYSTREFGSCENLSRKNSSMMLRRSRPDLIKGISMRSKEELQSERSKSGTDISNLSQSVSENSLHSSESASEKKKRLQNLGGHAVKSLEVRKEKAKRGEVRKDQGKKPLPVVLKKKERRSEIVDAVTNRLYVTKKISDKKAPTESDKKKKEEEEDDDDDDNDEAFKELKLCRIARMKLFDLSRKLAMTRKIKKTMDNDTQTDSLTATLRFKEKCVTTDLKGLGDYNAVGNIDESFKEKEEPCMIMNQVFIPKASNYFVECGKVIRIEAPEMENRYESTTQTSPKDKSYKNANTSPIKFNPQEDDYFSEDSLDSEDKNRSYDEAVKVMFPREKRKSKYKLDPGRNVRFNGSSELGFCSPCDSEGHFKEEFKTQNFSKVKESKESLLTGLTEDKIFSSEEMCFAPEYASNSSLEESRKENNPSSENSLNSTEETDISCSSETTSEDFVFYENFKDFGLKTKAASDRELYTITENSEQSDPSDTFSPAQSQISFLNPSNEDTKNRDRMESLPHHLQVNGLGFEKMKREFEIFDRPKDTRDDDQVESKLLLPKNKGETEQFGKVFKNSIQSFGLAQGKAEKLTLPKSVSILTSNVISENSDVKPNNSATPLETRGTCNETEKKTLKFESVQIQTDDINKRSSQTNWKDFQQKHYLNLNISNSSRTSPFFVDTHLFGESSLQDQSTDTMFNSADSITFVFMGPAKPKTSVLMEIIQRSLGNSSFSHGKLRDKGVPYSENLMRSVSMDTAMIALSRIAKNQQPSTTQKSFSLETLSSNEAQNSFERERVQIQRETSGQGGLKVRCFKREKKNSGIKGPISTSALVDEKMENKAMKSKGANETEKAKKFVSWFGEGKHLEELKSIILDKPDKLEATNFDMKHRNSSKLKAQELNEGNSSKLSSTSRESEPVERRVRFLRPDNAAEPTESLTAFLKEAIQLLKNLNLYSSKHQAFHNETAMKFGDEVNGTKKENDKRRINKFKNSDTTRKSKTESCLEKGENRRSKMKVGKSERKMDENHFNLTWPRRRQKMEKLPMKMKTKVLRSPPSLRCNSLHSNDSLGSTSNSSQSNRVASNPSNLSTLLSNSCSEESQNRRSSSRSSYNSGSKWLRDSYSHPNVTHESDYFKLNFNSILELESELEESCRRLEMAVEQDKTRESIFENWNMGLQRSDHVTGFRIEADDTEEEYQTTVRKAKEVVKRRKMAECMGGCTCTTSGIDPCKYLWSTGCRSSFELDSFGPGSSHCQQLCMFCRKKDEEMYYSALCLNSECLSAGLCRLNFYGFCPCSSFRLSHFASSPRAYLQHLLSLRRQIVNGTKRQERSSASRNDKRKNSFIFSS